MRRKGGKKLMNIEENWEEKKGEKQMKERYKLTVRK